MSEEEFNQRRRTERIDRRLACRFELANIPDTQTHVGTVTDLTELGLRIESRSLCPPGADVTVYVQANDRMIVLLARVVWWRLEAFAHAEQMRFSAGVELLYDVPAWSEFVTLQRQTPQKRENLELRYDAVHRVRVAGASEMLTEYTENLSRGGMYLATERLLEIGARITIDLELPGQAEPLRLDAMVAHKLDAKQAEAVGRPPGVGVKFVDWSAPARERLHHYIRRLDVHRSRLGRVDLQSLPKAGALSDYLVPELLIAGGQTGVSGILRLEHRGIFKSIYLRDGRPCYVDSSVSHDRFGDYLVAHDIISQSQLSDALGEAAQQKCKMGEVIVALGLMTETALQESLLACHEQKLFETFSLFDGNFALETTPELPVMVNELPLRIEGLVFEGVRHGYDSNVVCAWTGMSPETVFELLDGRAPDTETLPLEVSTVLRSIKEGPRSIEQMGDRTGQSFDSLVPLLYAMWLFGWVRPERRADELPLVEIDAFAAAEETLPELQVEPDETPNAMRAENEQKAAEFAARGDALLARGDMLGAYKQYGLAVAFAPLHMGYGQRMRELEALVGKTV